MTTYTPINANEIDSGSPLTESLMYRFANNLKAVLEGDSTAPKIYPKIMPQDSGGLKLETSRSGGSLQSTGSGFYEFLVINYTSDFSAAITSDIAIEYHFGGAQDVTNLELRLDETLIDSLSGSNLLSGTWAIEYDLPAGTHTLSFRAKNQFSNGNTTLASTSTMTAKGSWL